MTTIRISNPVSTLSRVVPFALVLFCFSCKQLKALSPATDEVDSEQKQQEHLEPQVDLQTKLAERLSSRDTALKEEESAKEQLRKQETIIASLNTEIALKRAKVNKLNIAKAEAVESETPKIEAESKVSLPGKFLSKVTPKVVVIEGDQGSGTGFLCTIDDQVWVYTAAHVLSGNSKIKVRDSQGRVYKDFDYLECAEGVDLVRLKPKNPDFKGLELVSPDDAPKIGDVIVAIGNSLGTGSLSGEPGKVRNIEENMWEVDAEIIPGNSGGPIVSLKNGKVAGIVTHLIINRREGEDSLHGKSTTKRFAARLDKKWKWRRMSVTRFVKEWKHIEEMNRDSSIAWAVAYHMTNGPGGRGQSGRRDPSERRDPRKRLENMKLSNISKEIIARENKHIHVKRMKSWYDKFIGASQLKRNGFIDEGNNLLRQMIDDIRLKDHEAKAEDFSWFHRQAYESEREWRLRLTGESK